MFMKYSIVTRIYTEILINQAVDNFTSSRFRESRYNAASCRVLEKAGFQYEGTLRSNAVKNGKVIDMKMYSLLKTEM